MYKIAICDDNSLYRDYLKKAIKDNHNTPLDYTIYEYSSGEQMLMDMDVLFDLAIIDIQLPKKNGFLVAKELYKLNPTGLLVYCSGVVLPTMEAFKVQPYRYLLKQESTVEFEQHISDIMGTLKEKHSLYCDFHLEKGELLRKNTDDIIYISSCHNGSTIRCYTNESESRILQTIYIRDRMPAVCNCIKKDHFFLIQRSFLINFNYIVRVKKNTVIMEDELEINLSRKKSAEFHNAFSDYVGAKYRREKNI